jgi:transcriptional regulator with XRE-family HTH domain
MSQDSQLTPFAVLLRQHRRNARLTQEALAGRAGLSPRGISDLERGLRRAPYRHTVRQLADALELAPADRESLIEAARQAVGTQAAIRWNPPPPTLPEALSSFVVESTSSVRFEHFSNAHVC